MKSEIDKIWANLFGESGEYQIPKDGLKNRFGKYSIPNELFKLLEAQNAGIIDTYTIGFEITFDTYYAVSPYDCINFAHTGGDGDHFAFLTDFENYNNIYECPVVFICPMDDEDSHFLFAKNFKDFLNIMCQIKNAEQLRFNDIQSYNFTQGLADYENDILEFGPIYKDVQTKTINFIKEKFDLSAIDDLNDYYKDLYKSRNSKEFIKTLDTYNLRLNSAFDIHQTWLNKQVDLHELELFIKNGSENELKYFLRNMPYLYEWWSNDYALCLMKVANSLPKKFEREKIIIIKRLEDIESEKEKSNK